MPVCVPACLCVCLCACLCACLAAHASAAPAPLQNLLVMEDVDDTAGDNGGDGDSDSTEAAPPKVQKVSRSHWKTIGRQKGTDFAVHLAVLGACDFGAYLCVPVPVPVPVSMYVCEFVGWCSPSVFDLKHLRPADCCCDGTCMQSSNGETTWRNSAAK